jgi:REP element-mobilizing transposase RayT
MMDYWWNELSNHFDNKINLDEYVIMPNHIHGIIVIKNINKGGHAGPPVQKIVGAGRCACPNDPPVQKMVGVDRCVEPNDAPVQKIPIKLGDVIRWFKTITTNEYIKERTLNNWPKFDKRIWQRNYYERIIRNEKEYIKVKNYIKANMSTGGQVL